jgi:hypothetical protein
MIFVLRLETVNTILQHSSHENPHFVAAVVGAHPLFAMLSSFNLVNGLHQFATSSQEPTTSTGTSRALSPNHTVTLSPDSHGTPSVSLRKHKGHEGANTEFDLAALAISIGRNGFVPTEEWVSDCVLLHI